VYTDIEFPFETTSHDFLKIAEKDLEQNSNHGNINALTNAKRAIDCQVEAIVNVLGLKKEKQFPKKIERIKEVGLIAPRILSRLNKIRNMLEHDFITPEREKVEDAVDIAHLFVELSHRIFRQLVFQFAIYEPCFHKYEIWTNWGPNYLLVEFDPENKEFCIKGSIDEKLLMDYKINKASSEYIPLLRLSILADFAYSDVDDKQAFNEMVEHVLS
jgi:hypothetical protein